MSSGYETGGYSGAMKSTADTLAAISKETFIGPFWIAFGGHGVINNLLDDDPRYQDLLRRMNLPEGK